MVCRMVVSQTLSLYRIKGTVLELTSLLTLFNAISWNFSGLFSASVRVQKKLILAWTMNSDLKQPHPFLCFYCDDTGLSFAYSYNTFVWALLT